MNKYIRGIITVITRHYLTTTKPAKPITTRHTVLLHQIWKYIFSFTASHSGTKQHYFADVLSRLVTSPLPLLNLYSSLLLSYSPTSVPGSLPSCSHHSPSPLPFSSTLWLPPLSSLSLPSGSHPSPFLFPLSSPSSPSILSSGPHLPSLHSPFPLLASS